MRSIIYSRYGLSTIYERTKNMIIRNLNSSHDWLFGSGLGCYLTGNAAIGLNIETRILSWVNDCFFDMGAGIDWANRLGSKNQQTLLINDLKRIILQSYGVTGIVSFDISVTGRAFTANYVINTIYTAGYANTVTQELGTS